MDSQLEDFHWWITIIPERIEELKHALPPEIAGQLDRTITSLDVLEKYLLNSYTCDQLRLPENASLYDGLARYVGSTVIHSVDDVEWYIELEDKNDIYFNVPVLIAKKAERSPLCPLSLVTALFDRNVDNYMSTVAKSYGGN
jgi:hypothetical protein